VKLAMAVGLYQPRVCGIVRAPLLLGPHVVDVERLAIFERLVTVGARPVLVLGESPAAIRHRSG
jgi:hypothetical protein